MNCSRTFGANTILTKQSAAQIFKAINGGTVTIVRPGFAGLQHQQQWSQRNFSNFKPAQAARLKEYFPVKETPAIRETKPAWEHPIYTQEQMDLVSVAHRNTRTFSDKVALLMVRALRLGLDFAMGYRHDKKITERQYLVRNLFLESVAGVPGMVAGMMRHLHSLRRMKRDNGWMETLLEESYNERMHLLTFLQMAEPGWFMRVAVLATQGVFFNAFFLSYLVSPKTCHRFVGFLEEEAVITYTRQIEDIDAGHLPKWETLQAPEIAIKYWRMPEGHRSMKDLLLYIRADESKHREVNHTLGNLDQKNDPNPYVSQYKDVSVPHPSKGIQHQRPTGWERHEVI